MKSLSYIKIFLIASGVAFGGRPIQLSEAKACVEADVFLIADIKALEDIPETEPFGTIDVADPDTGSPFSRFATIDTYRLLIGDGRYRAVDWKHGLLPVKEGRGRWPNPTHPEKEEWIPIDDALLRIKAYGKQSELGPRD